MLPDVTLPLGVVTVIVRVPTSAPASIVIETGKLVAVPKVPNVAVTPVPLNVTAVGMSKLEPEIVAEKVVP